MKITLIKTRERRRPVTFLFAVVGAALIGGAACADVTLSVERVRQRYPWNGLVDIDYAISGMPATELPCDWTVEMVARAVTNGQEVVIACSNFVQAAWCDLPVGNGTHRVTWNADLDGAGLFATDCQLTATLVRCPVSPREADFMIVDVSAGRGTDAKYPIRYVRAPDAPTSLFNIDRYKLDHLVLKRVKACAFRMGNCDTEMGTQGGGDANWHSVTLTQDYFLGVFPVTRNQYSLIDADPSSLGNTRADVDGERAAMMPLDATPWNTFADEHTGFFFYLNSRVTHHAAALSEPLFWFPTEAQWECACRAGTTTKYFWGSDANDAIEYGTYAKELPNHLHEVGRRKPNPWGFYDMIGNAWQYCADISGRYDAGVGYDSSTHSVTDPEGAASGDNRVKRGPDFSTANRADESSGYRGSAPPNWTQGGVRVKAKIL